jgi:hypothetical protein
MRAVRRTHMDVRSANMSYVKKGAFFGLLFFAPAKKGNSLPQGVKALDLSYALREAEFTRARHPGESRDPVPFFFPKIKSKAFTPCRSELLFFARAKKSNQKKARFFP